eukprot:6038305-Pleurochrysis_carterae.AAC.1
MPEARTIASPCSRAARHAPRKGSRPRQSWRAQRMSQLAAAAAEEEEVGAEVNFVARACRCAGQSLSTLLPAQASQEECARGWKA